MKSPCGAKKRGTTDLCRAPAMPNGRCRIHGGKAPTGIAHSQFTTGRYSKHIPSRMAARYQEAQDDPELLAMREEVRLLDARLLDVLSRVDTGESGKIWAELQKAWRTYRTGPPEKRMEAEAAISDLISDGASDYEAWEDVRSLIDQRSRLVAGERQRLVQMQQFITAEKAMNLVGAVMASVRQHVRDRAVLSAIASDLGALSLRDGS